MNADRKPSLAPHVRMRPDRITGQTMLLGPETALALNEVAVAVLELSDGERTIEEIARELAKEYEAPPEEMLKDIDELLTRLSLRGYIRISETL